jgi:hypothetical protein
MKKGLGVVLGVVVVLVLVLVIGKNMIAKTAVTGGVKAVTGLQLDIGKMDVGLSQLGITNMTLYNPDNFTDRVMVDMPEIYVGYDIGAFIIGNVHLTEVRVDLKELTVVKNSDGSLNLDSLKAAKSEDAAEEPEPEKEADDGKKTEISIDLLKLKVGKVAYKDYSKGDKPKVIEYNVDLDEEYENVTDMDKVVKIIIFNALVNTNIAKLTNFDLSSIKAAVPESVAKAAEMGKEALQEGGKKATEAVESVTEGAGESVTEGLKKLKLPFGK